MSNIICLLLMTLIASAVCSPRRNVDCRKFVYAPECRGVAAKRSQEGKSTGDIRPYYLDSPKLLELLRGFSVASEEDAGTILTSENNSVSPSRLRKPPAPLHLPELPIFYDYANL